MITDEIKTKIKLPIKTDASITSECWTYYKLSVIETSPDANAWLASHMELYFDKNYNAFFGKYDAPFNLDYYNEILEYEEIDIDKINPDNIIEIIIEEIKLGNYIVVYLTNPVQAIHEIVIHGFDTERELLFYNNLIDGKFKETSISFDDFICEHNKVYDFFRMNPFSRVVTSWYFFPITRLRLKKYKDDLCLLRAIKKLTNELNGKKLVIANLHSNENEEYAHYTGLACLVGFEHRLGEYIKDQRFIKGEIFFDLSKRLTDTLFKFYEYYSNICGTMEWISIELNGKLTLLPYISEFKNSLLLLKKIYMMAIKFSLTENWDVFLKLFEQYKYLYELLKKSIDLFCNEANRLLFEKEIC